MFDVISVRTLNFALKKVVKLRLKSRRTFLSAKFKVRTEMTSNIALILRSYIIVNVYSALFLRKNAENSPL